MQDTSDAEYLHLMMLIRILFYFILFYSLFKIITRVVLPLLIGTRQVRAQMKDMKQTMEAFEAQKQSTTTTAPQSKEAGFGKQNTTASKGDYIDFEEVK